MYLRDYAKLGICLPLIFTSGNVVSAANEITSKLTISGRVINAPCQTSLELDKLVSTCSDNNKTSRNTINLTQLELIRKTELTFARLDYQWVDQANTMAIKISFY